MRLYCGICGSNLKNEAPICPQHGTMDIRSDKLWDHQPPGKGDYQKALPEVAPVNQPVSKAAASEKSEKDKKKDQKEFQDSQPIEFKQIPKPLPPKRRPQRFIPSDPLLQQMGLTDDKQESVTDSADALGL